MTLLELKYLSKKYGSGHTQIKAVDDVSFQLDEGEIVLVMGPSGSGKTTLITIAGALLKPSSGQVLINGHEITRLSEKQLPKIRLTEFGFVFQSFNLLSSMDCQENVALPLIANGVKRRDALIKAALALTKLGLGDHLKSLPKNLSGGEKQRVAIARAIINNPKIIFADEPTANLDSKTGKEVMNLFCDIVNQEKRSVVIVSHDQRLKDIADRVVWFEDGKITNIEQVEHSKNKQAKFNS